MIKLVNSPDKVFNPPEPRAQKSAAGRPYPGLSLLAVSLELDRRSADLSLVDLGSGHPVSRL